MDYLFSYIYCAVFCNCWCDNGTAYTIKVSKFNNSDWRFAVGDFIGYSNDNKINAILEMSQSDYDDAIQHYNGHSFNESFLREMNQRY